MPCAEWAVEQSKGVFTFNPLKNIFISMMADKQEKQQLKAILQEHPSLSVFQNGEKVKIIDTFIHCK